MNDEPLTRTFACDAVPASAVLSESVGNKAGNLIRMAAAGLPVPPGFVITTRLCGDYFDRGCRLPDGFSSLLAHNIEHIERVSGLRFGGQRRPLLLAVRSGAPVSMPGMMDTILNIGLCDRTTGPLIRMTGNPRFVWDSYRRLVQAFAEVVHGLPADLFEQRVSEQMQRASVPSVGELDVFALRQLTQQFLRIYATHIGAEFPQEPLAQLAAAAEAVLRSWRSPRAREFRRLHAVDERLGTAVTVQAMVFGNMGATSGSGVAFTRDPTNGVNELYLDFLWNAQGEDIVSGRRVVPEGSSLRNAMPALFRRLRQISAELEQLFRDVQDFEFTVQEGQLYVLQSRAAKRTAVAALRIACELVQEGVIDEHNALERLAEYDLSSLRVTRLASARDRPPLSVGIPASPGVAVGQMALDPRVALRMAREGCRPILVRHDISTDDIAGFAASEGILTTRGGRTSHAAVVARQMNKVCIVGCRGVEVEPPRSCRIGDQRLAEGDFLSLDGQSGKVYAGQMDVITEQPTEYLALVERWRHASGPNERGKVKGER